MTVVTAAMTEVTGAMTDVMTEVTGARTAATVAPDPGCSASPTATGERVWRSYAHLFEEARLAPDVAMVDAIEQARAELERAGLRPGCAQGAVRVL